jgi:hypothetical protein
MELKVSRPVQIAALVGILAAVGGFFGFSMLGGGGGSAAPGHRLIRHPHGLRTAPKHRSSPKTTSLAPPSTKRVKQTAAPKRAKPKPKPPVTVNGLPVGLARALARSPVVVAMLYDPEAKVDGASYGEAKAGAALAGVPFVAVNVMRRAEVQAISEKFSVISDPAVLILRSPDQLYLQLNGFADKETVAQAVANAQSGSALLAAAAPRSS